MLNKNGFFSNVSLYDFFCNSYKNSWTEVPGYLECIGIYGEQADEIAAEFDAYSRQEFNSLISDNRARAEQSRKEELEKTKEEIIDATSAEFVRKLKESQVESISELVADYYYSVDRAVSEVLEKPDPIDTGNLKALAAHYMADDGKPPFFDEWQAYYWNYMNDGKFELEHSRLDKHDFYRATKLETNEVRDDFFMEIGLNGNEAYWLGIQYREYVRELMEL
jgi:hypothetical protein